MAGIWKCPKCGRLFQRAGQQHSCTAYPVEKHLKGKDVAKPLYGLLLKKIRKDAGAIRIESLPCCIHLVNPSNGYTFGAVYALRDRIRVHFTVGREIKSKRLGKFVRMSSARYLYSIEARSAEELDGEMLALMKEAYGLKGK